MKKTTLILWLSALIFVTASWQAHGSQYVDPTSDLRSTINTREQIKEVIENLLFSSGVNPHQLTGTLFSEYKKTVETATAAINNLIQRIESIVFLADVKYEISSAITKRLLEHNLQRTNIPSSLKREFTSKCDNIKKRTRRLLRYNDNEYVTRQENREIVRSELDYNFIKKRII